MKKHMWVKFLALALCAGLLLISLVSAGSIVVLSSAEAYDTDMAQVILEEKVEDLTRVARVLAKNYASQALGGCPAHFADYYYAPISSGVLAEGKWYYTIQDAQGKLLESTSLDISGAVEYEISVGGSQDNYYKCLEILENPEIDPHQATTTFNGVVMPGTADGSDLIYIFYNEDLGNYTGYRVTTETLPQYKVVLYLAPDAYTQQPQADLLLAFWNMRYHLFWILGLSLLGFAVTLVFLCSVAGSHRGDDTLRPGGLNLLPLDLYAGCDLMLGCFLLYVVIRLGDYWNFPNQNLLSYPMVALAVAYFLCLMVTGYLYAFAAQVRTGNGYWWRHSVIFIAARTCWKVLLWAIRWGCSLARKVWRTGKTFFHWATRLCIRFLCFCWGKCRDLLGWTSEKLARGYSLLPLTWQWLVTGLILFLALAFSLLMQREGLLVLAVLLYFGMVFYGASAFGTLLAGARAMAQGNLEQKVDSKYLVGGFRDFSDSLNDLAGVAVIAAQKQMKSERMKTELITNVSHDIKTPLTSIINYVDLLQQNPTQEEAVAYLDVLSRQSLRMKKLIEDLMEMSKASTGNLTVEIRQVDAVEAVTQALGEFSDKLSAARLTPVFHAPAEAVTMQADGRLCWRVLSNLLSNAVKYALPGTRVYVDLSKESNQVRISLKNISRESLNVDAQELMERFVRGDSSRNTEGSGLGLNIAQSLMEVQHGKLELVVDGDLFKATLVFPAE